MAQRKNAPLVGVVMGSDSDWDIMRHAATQLDAFGIAYEARVAVGAPDARRHVRVRRGRRAARPALHHRRRGRRRAPARECSRRRPSVPVLGVPVPSKYLRGEDSLYSIVQMPKGIPVATFAIGEAGAANAGLFAVAMIAATDPAVARKLAAFRVKQTNAARAMRVPPAALRRLARDARRLVRPGALAGALGGGQLGRMFCMAAQSLGYRVAVLDPASTAPPASVADRHIRADYLDPQGLAELAALARAATTEFENVPAAALEFLARTARVTPGRGERRDRAGPDPREDLPVRATASRVAPYAVLRSERAARGVDAALAAGHRQERAHGLRRQGPDPRRDARRRRARAWTAMGGRRLRARAASSPLACEVSVDRRAHERGETATWPVAENRHRDGILDVSIVPARVSDALAAHARGDRHRRRRRARLPRRAVRRDVRDGRGRAARQRDRAAAAQQRPLHDRRLRDVAVRAAGARARGPAARRHAPARRPR